MTTIKTPRPLSFAVIAGVLCGAALIATSVLSRNGWLMLLPYLVLALASGFYLQRRGVGAFGQRFVPCLLAYVVATAIVIVYIETVVRPHTTGKMTSAGFVLPFVYMLVLGAAGSAIVAAITGSKSTAH
jgi:hypothetical protein